MTLVDDALSIFLPTILGYFHDDYTLLYCCCLVDREFHHVASSLLYARVVLSPPFRPVLDLKDRDGLSSISQMFGSALLPHNVHFVKSFQIGGSLSARPPPLNQLGTKFAEAMRSFRNLRCVSIVPDTFHVEVFPESLRALRELPLLRELCVNPACQDELRAPILAEIEGLEILRLVDPKRAVLSILPEWLSRQSSTLRELHLLANCGSITPGVLRSFVPHIRRLRAVSLGLSYSLTDQDVFSFLGELPEISSVQLHYYLQLKLAERIPSFPALTSFTVIYSQMNTRQAVNRLCKWVRKIICRSPLKRLSLQWEDADDIEEQQPGPCISFHPLIEHIIRKHYDTIERLDFRSALVDVEDFKDLCRSCVGLDEVIVGVNPSSLLSFSELGGFLYRLHTAHFYVRNVQRRRLSECIQQGPSILAHGPSALRRLGINGHEWEGFWTAVSSTEVEFQVEPMQRRKAPCGR